MRWDLRNAIDGELPDHLGLAYDSWAPSQVSDGKVSDDNRRLWLEDLAERAASPDYARSFERWKQSFSSTGDRLAELTLTSRLLIGHGNASAIDVGLTVHHTWGVPIIPGSALKGLLAHYVDATYGPADPTKLPWDQQGEERARADYQGLTWDEQRIKRGPGSIYRALFGAPDARDDDAMRQHGLAAGASSGCVVFHDALYLPGSAASDRPFATDVLTPHQQGSPDRPGYYDSSGDSFPNDYTSPIPVAFLSVRPQCRFLLALSGPSEWTELAAQLLADALKNWGVGGKTAAGYGIGTTSTWRQPELKASKTLAEFEAWLAEEANAALPQRQRLGEISQQWSPKLASLSDHERIRAVKSIKDVIKSPKLTQQRDALLEQLLSGNAR